MGWSFIFAPICFFVCGDVMDISVVKHFYCWPLSGCTMVAISEGFRVSIVVAICSLILLFYNSVDNWKMIFAPCVMLACSLVGFEIISWFAGSMRVLLNHSMPLQKSTRCPFTLHLFLKCLACLNEKHY